MMSSIIQELLVNEQYTLSGYGSRNCSPDEQQYNLLQVLTEKWETL